MTLDRRPVPEDVRAFVLQRAKYRCECCGENKPLELHHLTYIWNDPYDPGELIFGHETPSDLQALCRECHHNAHMLWGEFYADIDELNDLSNSFD